MSYVVDTTYMDKQRLTYLFHKHFSSTCSETEKEELSSLLHSSEYQEEILGIMEEAWKSYRATEPIFSDAKSKRLLSNILQHPLEEEIPDIPAEKETLPSPAGLFSSWRWWGKIAAVIICAIGIGFYFIQSKTDIPVVATSAFDPVHRATLTLSDGSIKDVSQWQLHEIVVDQNSTITKLSSDHLLYEYSNKPTSSTNYTHTLQTPKGGQYTVTLPDGSKVWLNAASSIAYSTTFTNQVRKVWLQGEAYFEVAKSKNSVPFMVEVNNTTIEVLGTQFNVNASQANHSITTTLIEGSVKIHQSANSQTLHPGQEASTNSLDSTIIVKQADIEKALAWKNGYFQFDQTPLEEVMQQLSNWYDVEVKYEKNIPSRAFSGEIPRSYTLPQVLEILEISQVQFNQHQKTILIQN